jgi:excisionase family DNA binding protein
VLPDAVRKEKEARKTPSAIEIAQALSEAREALRGYETTALASVAVTLAEAAESLTRTARELHEMRRDEWMTIEQAASYLQRTSKAFEKIVAMGEIPRHYITERGILFNRKELDEWLLRR